MPTNELLAEVDYLRTKLTEKEKRLAEAEGLLKRYYNLLDEGNLVEPELCFEADELHELTEAFLSTPTNPDMVLVKRDAIEDMLETWDCTCPRCNEIRHQFKAILEKPC